MTTPGPGGGGNLGNATGTIVIRFDDGGVNDATRALNDLGGTARRQSATMADAGKKIATVGAVIAGGFLLSIRAAANFEKQLSNVQAVSSATTTEMQALRDKALQLGKDTAFSAGEAASAMEELVKAGLSVEDVLNGAADATVALAAAGGIGLAEAATIGANAMNQFGLAAQELPGVADAIAGAANASAIDVGQFGQSLAQVGAVANLADQSFQDTATAIALLGNAGIVGSDAGTSLKTALNNLNPTTEKQIALFKELGIVTADGNNTLKDAQGNFKGLADISEILGQAFEFSTLSTEDFNAAVAKGVDPLELLKDAANETGGAQRLMRLETAFGSDAIRAAAILAKNGAAGFNDMSDALGRVSAADVAATKMDNLAGTIEELKGSFETFMITVGTPFLGVVRDVVANVNKLIGAFLALPGPVQDVIAITGALGGGFLLLVGTTLLAIDKITKFKTAIQAFLATSVIASLRSRLLGLALLVGPGGLWVAGFAAAAAAIGALFLMNRKGKPNIDDLTEAIRADTGALKENSRAALANRLEKDGALEAADRFGISLFDVTEATLGNTEAQERLNAAIAEARKPLQDTVNQIDQLASQNVAAGAEVQNLGGKLGEQEDAARADIAALDKLAESVGGNASAAQQALVAENRHTRALQESANQATVTTAAEDRLNRALNRLATESGQAATGARNLTTDVAATGAAAGLTEGDIKGLNDALKALFDRAFGAQRALDTFQTKLNGLKEAAKQNGTALKGTSDAAIANREGFFDAAEALGAYATQLTEQGKSPAFIAGEIGKLKDQLFAQGEAAGFSREKVETLLTVLGDVQDQYETRIVVDTRSAFEKLYEVQNFSLNDKTIRINTVGGIGALEAPKMARGGIVSKARLALVGEAGPEAIVPLPDLAGAFLRIYEAGQTTLTAAEATSGRTSTARGSEVRSGASRLVQGSLSIDRSGRAWIRGVAEDVYDGEDRFATTYGRMG